jgi:hypothetical protein
LKTASIQEVLADGFVFVECCLCSGGFCFGSALETADFALDLSDTLLFFENLAIDPIQFLYQFLSTSLQAAWHGGVPDVVEPRTASSGTSLPLSAMSKQSFSKPSMKNSRPRSTA